MSVQGEAIMLQLLRWILILIWRPQKRQWDTDTQEGIEQSLSDAKERIDGLTL